MVADCRVQGEKAPELIVTAFQRLQRLPELDVVIVARGGGSSEDLSCFNDERVAREIANCKVPVVSGVGHEIDMTIADLVADQRAATPSNAAELVLAERHALQDLIENIERNLQRAMESRIDRSRLQLERNLRVLYHSRRVINTIRSRLQKLCHRLQIRDPRAVLRQDRQTWMDLDPSVA